MGGNKRYADRPLLIPTWAATVAAMQASGAHVFAACRRGPACGYHKRQIDYAALIAAGHGQLSLFDYHPPCPRCRVGRILFCYSASPSTPTRPCVTLR